MKRVGIKEFQRRFPRILKEVPLEITLRGKVKYEVREKKDEK